VAPGDVEEYKDQDDDSDQDQHQLVDQQAAAGVKAER
jgi:hypothetical protein